MTDQINEPDPETIIRAEILAIDEATDRLIQQVSRHIQGTPDFTQIKLVAALDALVELGVIAPEQRVVIDLKIARAVHGEMVKFARMVDEQLQAQRSKAIRNQLTFGVPGVPQS